MQLTSNAFDDGATIPRRYTGDGDNVSPALAWSGVPAGTRSFALVCEDPDAPRGTWHHWAIFDIPADRRRIAESTPRGYQIDGLHQAQNDFHRSGYDGPLPPHGHGSHHYRFRLIALSIEHLPLGKNPPCSAVATAAKKHSLATAELTGLYAR